MLEILGITASFFAIIALGSFTKYIGLFDEKSSQIFSNFAFYVALPSMKETHLYLLAHQKAVQQLFPY